MNHLWQRSKWKTFYRNLRTEHSSQALAIPLLSHRQDGKTMQCFQGGMDSFENYCMEIIGYPCHNSGCPNNFNCHTKCLIWNCLKWRRQQYYHTMLSKKTLINMKFYWNCNHDKHNLLKLDIIWNKDRILKRDFAKHKLSNALQNLVILYPLLCISACLSIFKTSLVFFVNMYWISLDVQWPKHKNVQVTTLTGVHGAMWCPQRDSRYRTATVILKKISLHYVDS